MAGQNSHHRSKERRISIIVVPNGDDSRSKYLRIAPWQLVILSTAVITLIIGIFVALLIFTPLGVFLNIPNPELEFRYSTQLITLNQRLESVMSELVELRAYQVKVRNVLGENVVATDSGVVVLTNPRISSKETSVGREAIKQQVPRALPRLGSGESFFYASVSPVRGEQNRVVFPAILPAEGYISREFNPAIRHFGLDVAGKVGTPVLAAADGYIVFSGWTHEEGYVLILSHANGFLTFYKHNQSLLKSENTYVKRGEPIALLGNTGSTSYGPHLHFEVWKDGTPVDPALYLLNIKS